jgi:IS30 family transposase
MTHPLRDDLRQIQAARRRARPKHFRPSRLDPYRSEIEALAEAGGSLEDIRIWLRRRAKIEVHGSTIFRALRRWQRSTASEPIT